MAQKVISTTILIAIMCQFSEQNPVSEPKNELLKETYAECNSKTSTCVGMPTGCVATQSCTVILSAKPTQTGADFMLHWTRDPSSMDKWVAAGISTDMKMGDDSVTECILRNHTMVKVRQGLTYCNKTDNGINCGVDTVEPVKGITKEMGTYSDENVLTCSWSRTVDTMVRNLDFNIQKNKYYILLAYGPTINGEPEHHTSKWVSKEAFILGQEIGNTTIGSTTPTVPISNLTTAKLTTTNGTTPKPTSAQPMSSTKMSTVTSRSMSTDNTTMPGNSTITTMPSNTTSTAGNTTPHHSKTTTKPKNGSKTITYGLSLGIFVTIVLSLNL